MDQDDTTEIPVLLIPEETLELHATPTASPPQQSTTTTTNTTTTSYNEDILPLAEPEFQILADFGEEYEFSSSNLDMSPSGELKFFSHDVKPNPKDTLFLMDSYPYDTWGSPGSVESDNLFPELA